MSCLFYKVRKTWKQIVRLQGATNGGSGESSRCSKLGVLDSPDILWAIHHAFQSRCQITGWVMYEAQGSATENNSGFTLLVIIYS